MKNFKDFLFTKDLDEKYFSSLSSEERKFIFKFHREFTKGEGIFKRDSLHNETFDSEQLRQIKRDSNSTMRDVYWKRESEKLTPYEDSHGYKSNGLSLSPYQECDFIELDCSSKIKMRKWFAQQISEVRADIRFAEKNGEKEELERLQEVLARLQKYRVKKCFYPKERRRVAIKKYVDKKNELH